MPKVRNVLNTQASGSGNKKRSIETPEEGRRNRGYCWIMCPKCNITHQWGENEQECAVDAALNGEQEPSDDD